MTSDQTTMTNFEEEKSEQYDEIALSEVVRPVLGKTPKRKDDGNWGGNIKWASAKDISQNKRNAKTFSGNFSTPKGE